VWQSLWKAHGSEFDGLAALEERLGYSFKDRHLLFEALTHRSVLTDYKTKFEKGSVQGEISSLAWNERLEFLGDSVLNLVVSRMLWDYGGDRFGEGELSRARASLVNESILAQVARGVDLGQVILLGRGEVNNGARSRDSLLADALEALMGAIYLDSDFDSAATVITSLINPLLHQGLENLARDYKTELQELTQDLYRVVPDYQVSKETGPDHLKEFLVDVFVSGECLAQASGTSKKRASQMAAKEALKLILDREQTKLKRNIK
jgi:ribonuclease-3